VQKFDFGNRNMAYAISLKSIQPALASDRSNSGKIVPNAGNDSDVESAPGRSPFFGMSSDRSLLRRGDEIQAISPNILLKDPDPQSSPLMSPERLSAYPRFKGAEYCEYKAFQRQQLNPLYGIPIATVCYVASVTRGSLQDFATDSPNYIFTAAIICFIFLSVVFVVFFPCCVVVYAFTSEEKKASRLYRMANDILNKWFWGRIEDFLGISGTLFGCLILVGRVQAGQCPPDTSIWDSQRCNPFADAGSFPQEQMIVVTAFPIICQALVKGITLQAVAVQYVFILTATLYCIIHVQGKYEIWTVLYSILFWNIAFEFEYRMRTVFKQYKFAKESKDREKKIAVEMAEMAAENEIRLAEAEKQQLKSLLGNVAHDLKTPLHSITTDLEALKSITDNAKAGKISAQESYNEIYPVYGSLEATCRFMLAAINRGMDFVKASSNLVLVPANESFHLTSAMALALNCIDHLQSGRHVLAHDLPPNVCPHLITDKHWMTENVMCLLSNAVKYSPSGTTIELRVELLESGGHDLYAKKMFSDNAVALAQGTDIAPMLLISVEDSGIGIAPEVRKRLFQPFKQAQRMAGGTGLGLFSLKNRIDALGGYCGVTDRGDGKQGSKFWFTVPYRPDPDAAAHTSAAELPSSAHVSPRDMNVDRFRAAPGPNTHPEPLGPSQIRPMRILLVDDTLTILKVASRTLKMHGHVVETAENGVESLARMKEAYEGGDIDMVLTDLQMPVMDGIEATRRYREFQREKLSEGAGALAAGVVRKLIIVGMSANSDPQTTEEALKAGMDGFIGKPFQYKDFEKVVLHLKGNGFESVHDADVVCD
jgi:signal transduction histidine kinase/AmiR/NasT family two-component response regulator